MIALLESGKALVEITRKLCMVTYDTGICWIENPLENFAFCFPI